MSISGSDSLAEEGSRRQGMRSQPEELQAAHFIKVKAAPGPCLQAQPQVEGKENFAALKACGGVGVGGASFPFNEA